MEKLNKKQIKKFFKSKRKNKEITLLLDSIQYARNIAAIFRTADAANVKKIYLSGISKTPPFGKELSKVSRSKEKTVRWEYYSSSNKAIKQIKKEGFYLVGIELTNKSEDISRLSYIVSDKDKVCFVFGNEVYGVKNEILRQCDSFVYLPMHGKGASLNVSTTAGIVLYSF